MSPKKLNKLQKLNKKYVKVTIYNFYSDDR